MEQPKKNSIGLIDLFDYDREENMIMNALLFIVDDVIERDLVTK